MRLVSGNNVGPGAWIFGSWHKYTKTFSDLSAASPTNNITLFSLPAGGLIHMVKIKHSVAFSGGGLTTYTISLGITGTLDKYASAFDVFQAAAATTFQISEIVGSESHTAATDIKIAAAASGNLNLAAAGSVDVWVNFGILL